MKTKILIADDHEIVRDGVRTLIERERPEWEICGEASTGTEAVRCVERLRPDVIILDLTMPGLSGLEAATRIAAKSKCRIVVFTMHDSPSLAAELRDVGAHGYVLKSEAARNLILAVESVVAGRTFYGAPSPNPAATDEPGNASACWWTPRFVWRMALAAV